MEPGVLTKKLTFPKLTRRILLVEDDPLVQQIHRNLLSIFDYHIDTANDGKTALDTIVNPYDIIILDIGLPDMTGIEVAQRIRHLEGNTATPVTLIALTAQSSEEIRISCFEAGFNEVLYKPLSIQELNPFITAGLLKTAP